MKSKHTKKPSKPPASDDQIVWGAAAMAPIINRDLRATQHLLKTGALGDAVTKIGGRFASTPRKLRARVVGG